MEDSITFYLTAKDSLPGFQTHFQKSTACSGTILSLNQKCFLNHCKVIISFVPNCCYTAKMIPWVKMNYHSKIKGLRLLFFIS